MVYEQQKKQERQILIAYLLMLLTVFSIVPFIVAYWLAARITHLPATEVWLSSHAFWIARNVLIFFCIAVFAALWFIPLFFFIWDQYIWVTACTVIGVIFAIVAWLYLLNAWLKGISRFIRHKPVY